MLRCSEGVGNVLEEEHVFKLLYGTSSIGGRANNAFEEWNGMEVDSKHGNEPPNFFHQEMLYLKKIKLIPFDGTISLFYRVYVCMYGGLSEDRFSH